MSPDLSFLRFSHLSMHIMTVISGILIENYYKSRLQVEIRGRSRYSVVNRGVIGKDGGST